MPGADETRQAPVFQRFAARCDERLERLRALLAEATTTAQERETQRNRLALELHDLSGETKLLGLERVANGAARLAELFDRWGRGFDAQLQGQRLDRLFSGLTAVAQRTALGALQQHDLQMLHEILAELGNELGVEKAGATATSEHRSVARRRILILDDSPIICEMLSMELEARGHEVITCSDAATFYAELERYTPHIVFLDINMPDIRGDDVCRFLRAGSRTTLLPVVFLSSLASDELAALARQAGASGYLSKQDGMDALLAAIDELLPQILV